MHIRCVTNKYNLQLVIDSCEDTDFVRLTDSTLNWIDIDGKAKAGDYFYNGKIISVDSPDYSIIEKIIYDHEESEKAAIKAKLEKEESERKAREAAEIAALEAEAAELEEREKKSAPIPIISVPADLSILRAEAKSHPKPKQVDYFNDPQPDHFTQEDLDMWDHRVLESSRLIEAVKAGRWENCTIFFDPPFHIAPGTPFESIREFDVVPHETKEEYVSYISANAQNIKKYRDHVAAKLGKK